MARKWKKPDALLMNTNGGQNTPEKHLRSHMQEVTARIVF
jgi:hypothetical protein